MELKNLKELVIYYPWHISAFARREEERQEQSMRKTINTFQVVVKDGVIQQIGRSYITQPAAVSTTKQKSKKNFHLRQKKGA